VHDRRARPTEQPFSTWCVRAEGYDPLVLDGAIPVLAGSGVRVFMFEYHGIGVWKDANVRLKVLRAPTTSPRISHVPSFTQHPGKTKSAP